MQEVAQRSSLFRGHDQYLFREGTHTRLYDNGWDPRAHPMQGSDAGVWSARVAGARPGGDWEQSVLAFMRMAPDAKPVVVVCNFTPGGALFLVPG